MNLNRLFRLKRSFAQPAVESRGDESDLKRLRDVQDDVRMTEAGARQIRACLMVLGYSREEIDNQLSQMGYRHAR